MSAKSDNLKDERGAFVLAPLPVMRGCFAVLVRKTAHRDRPDRSIVIT